ncbi:ribosomal RNA large subunit methyltransferase H [Clostridia bacterium]|nr:ribosomal RNA large subunit methyltransferase H [Clostridia bacterium]
MKINIIYVGKVKEEYFRLASCEYEKRLSAFAKLDLIEIPAVKLPEKAADPEIAAALNKEGKRILSAVSGLKKSCIIALAPNGTPFTSEQFADRIISIPAPELSFIIGSSHGLSPEVTGAAGTLLSLSGMTFPHVLAKIMLLEQIYRGFMINAGRTYHK